MDLIGLENGPTSNSAPSEIWSCGLRCGRVFPRLVSTITRIYLYCAMDDIGFLKKCQTEELKAV